MATQKEVAAHLDLSDRTIRELLRKKVLPRQRGKGALKLDECRVAYIRHLREMAAAHRSQDGKEDLVSERARLAREQADAQELKNRQLEGELISRRRAEDLLQRLAISAKERLRAIPAMAPGKIPKLTKADVVKLRKMIDDALRELAASRLPED